MKYKPPHPPVVYVEWHDSRSVTNGWRDREGELGEVDQLYKETAASVGFLFKTTKKYIVIGLALAPVDDIMHTIMIPRSEITVFKIIMKARGMKIK